MEKGLLVTMETAIKHKTIYELLFNTRNIFLDTFMILVSVVFMGIMANIRIALWPVPITMQTFGVFAIAFFFGSRKGLISMLAYVLAGIVGFGVFAGHKSGIVAVMGPTGGYIIGFLVAVFVVGMLIEKGFGRTKKSILYCMILGNVIIYALGLVGLKMNFMEWGLMKVFTAGMFPFLIGDALKVFAAVGLFPYLWKGSEKIAKHG